MPIYLKGNKLLTSNIPSLIDKTIIPNHINSSLSARLVGKTGSTSKPIYSSQNPYTNGVGEFIRNTNCWLNGVSNISCFSPAQLSGASWNTRGGTLITTKHILLARHYPISILSGGTPIIFVDENNNVVRRNLVQISNHPSTDIAIGLLDNDVPSNIKIAKVLPQNYSNYMTLFSGNLIYGVGIDQEEKALVKVNNGLQNLMPDGSYQTIAFDNAPINPFADFTENIVVGDSGNPVFFIIDNELVVLTTWWTPTLGPFINTFYQDVNNIIQALSPSTNYQLTPIDLQAVYNKYYPRSFRCTHQ
jgi:hypothetical protein